MSDGIRLERMGTTAVLTLDRPQRRNAFTLEMIDAWPGLLRDAEQDSEVTAIVLTGVGDSFCSGIDLEDLRTIPATATSYRSLLTDRIHQIAHTVDGLKKPLIAAINGPAVGAGLDMALMCDLRFAAVSATMSEGYIKLGLVPGDGGAHYLPRLVGTAKALELLWTGDHIDAKEAERIGMVNRVHPDDELMAATLAFTDRLAQHSAQALSLIKQAVRQGMPNNLGPSLDTIASHFGVVATTPQTQQLIFSTQSRR